MAIILSIKTEWNKAIKNALNILKKGGIIVYPTDTVYGIGADALNENAVNKIYLIKKRDKEKPLSVAVGNLEMLMNYFYIDKKQREVLFKYLPGPYTFLLKPKTKIAMLNKKVGVRIPDSYFIRKLSILLKKPIITTSANISGEPPATSLEKLDERIKNNVDLIIKGDIIYKKPSTVVDLINKKIIRKGVGEFSEF